MTRGAGRITIVHDPYDDGEVTHAALAANDPYSGTVAVHPTVGTSSPSMVALDVISALGYRGTGPVAALHLIRNADAAFAAATAWLLADSIETVIVPRAHSLPERTRMMLARMATAAEIRLVPIWHGHRPDNWAEEFPTHPRHLVTEADSLEPILAGARHKSQAKPKAATHPTEPLPRQIPATGLAGFRAQARRQLMTTEFNAVDAHYRHGMQAACRWVTNHPLRPMPASGGSIIAAPADQIAGPQAVAAGNLRCVGAMVGRQQTPVPFPDKLGVQALLCSLAVEAGGAVAAVARVRGAQAALLLHGLLLAVPADLTDTVGPGLSGIPLTAEIVKAIRAGIANPALALAVAIVALTGRAPEHLGTITMRSHNLASRSIIDIAAPQWSRHDMYTVPPEATSLLRAALHYTQLATERTPDLAFGVDSTNIAMACEELSLGLTDYAPVNTAPWHLRASCWHIGEPLHSPAPDMALPQSTTGQP